MGLSFPPFYFPDWHVIAIDLSNPQHLISGMNCWRNLVNSNDGGLSRHQTQQFPEGTQKGFAAVVLPFRSRNCVRRSRGLHLLRTFHLRRAELRLQRHNQNARRGRFHFPRWRPALAAVA